MVPEYPRRQPENSVPAIRFRSLQQVKKCQLVFGYLATIDITAAVAVVKANIREGIRNPYNIGSVCRAGGSMCNQVLLALDNHDPDRCLSLGTTQVPTARQTTTGTASTSAADSLMSVRGTMTFRASKTILREELPTFVI